MPRAVMAPTETEKGLYGAQRRAGDVAAVVLSSSALRDGDVIGLTAAAKRRSAPVLKPQRLLEAARADIVFVA